MFSQLSDEKHRAHAGRPLMAGALALAIVCGTMTPESLALSISAAVSRKAHGSAGSFDIDVHAAGAVECRSNGPTQVIVTFDESIQGVGGLDAADVVLTSGTVNSLSINGSDLTINMTGTTNAQPLTVAFPGIVNTSGLATTDTLCLAVLAGDVNASRTVNAFDLTSVRAQLGQSVSSSNFQNDVNCSGTLNAFDLTFVRARLGSQVAECTPMALVPAGEFQMGDTFSEGDSDELPVHAVYLDAYFMDRTEVTKSLWDTVRTWATSNGYSDLVTGGGKAADHPVHSVNWYDCVKWANARSQMQGRTPCYYTDSALTTVYKTGELSPYVKWDANGYRLPTEAEWEKAARGGVAGHRFPWSDSDYIQHDRANYYSSADYAYDTSPTRGHHPTFATGSYPYTSPVGYFAANGYGLYDIAGNAWEWCNDWWSSSYYSSSPYNNPRGPTSGTYRVLRGGRWNSGACFCRVAHRDYYYPDIRSYINGFRLALDSP